MNMRTGQLKWRIAWLLAAATALSYIDRQSFPVLAHEIGKTIPLSDGQYGELQFAFLLTYGLMYAAGGWLLDRLGVRVGLAVSMAVWSGATVLHGMVTTVAGLGAARILLGLGEGGGFPGAAKAVAEHFRAKERSVAFGLFNAGSSLGAVIAPPLIAAIVLASNWRWVFPAVGSLGFLWLVFWWRMYATPEPEDAPVAVSEERVGWLQLLGQGRLWALLIAKFLSDAAWYFFIFWLPKYLADARHLDIKAIGYFAWIPYAFGAVGSFAGGLFSSYLIRRGVSLDLSRRISLGLAAAMLPASLWIVESPLGWAIVFFSMAMCGHQFFSTMMQTLTADMYAPGEVGSVAGMVGAAGSFGGMFFNLLVGRLLDSTHSYSLVFLLAGLFHPLAFFVLLAGIRRIDRGGIDGNKRGAMNSGSREVSV